MTILKFFGRCIIVVPVLAFIALLAIGCGVMAAAAWVMEEGGGEA